MAKARLYDQEKRRAFEACQAVVAGRPRGKKKDRILVSEIREESGLEVAAASNAMKWLKRRGLAHTSEDGKVGWFVEKRTAKQIERYCWEHGEEFLHKGKRWYCEVCERNK